MILHRIEESASGIFGVLTDIFGKEFCKTLEHAYDSGQGNGTFAPKLPPGEYICRKGQHRLEGMTTPFTTFEITDVPGHTNILFHPGNTEADSEGCVLLGTYRQGNSIMKSRDAWNKLMDRQKNVDKFTLTVE